MYCPSCGRPAESSATHCSSCGTPLTWAPPPPAGGPDPWGGEIPPPPAASPATGADPSLAQIGPALQASLGILQLDRGAIGRVAATDAATMMAAIFIAVVGACPAIAHFFFVGIILGPILALVVAAIGVGIVHMVATMLGGKGEYLSLFRCHGFLSVFGVVSIVPILGSIAAFLLGIWELVVLVPVLETTHGLTRERAILAVVILFVLALVLSTLIAVGLVLAGVSLLGMLAS